MAVKGTNLVVTVEDEAPVFDPTSRPEPDTSVSPRVRGPHGMGIHLMRLATDAIAHRPRDGGGNILTMTRSLVAQPQEDR